MCIQKKYYGYFLSIMIRGTEYDFTVYMIRGTLSPEAQVALRTRNTFSRLWLVYQLQTPMTEMMCSMI